MTKKRKPMRLSQYEYDVQSTQSEDFQSSYYNANDQKVIQTTFYYAFDVLAGALIYVKPLVTLMVAIVLFFTLLSYGYKMFQEIMFDTVCPVPFIGTYLPVCKDYSPVIPDFTHFVKLQESLHDSMLSRPPTDAISAMKLKQVELATRDLQAMVKHSNLMSADLLESKLGEYIVRSRQFGRDLQSLQAQTRGVIDNLITYNTFTFRKLSEVEARKSSRQDLRALYEKAMGLVEKEAKRLILAIEMALSSLHLLEEDLYGIHEITIQEKTHQISGKPDIFVDLINQLTNTGIRRKLVEDNLELLVNFDTERAKATQQLMLMMSKMESFQMDLEELRSQVAAPILIPDTIPLEMHIENIGKAIERLKSSKVVFFEEKLSVESNQ